MSDIDTFNAEQRRTSAQDQSNADRQNNVFAEEQQVKVAVVGGGP
jgi:hypothetical protein